ncbi:MAG: hypothetical protein DDT26_01046 [Dehalococcoidia bacterium]|nr:hypothetical protein [Chloroflexota bacterium]
MARLGYSETVFIRYDAGSPEDIHLRIRPQAVRWQQNGKGGTADTLGGWYREILHSDNPQYSGLTLADLTVQAETGLTYRAELQRLLNVWQRRGVPKADGSPADYYFFDLTEVGDWNGLARDQPRGYLVDILGFAYDDTVSSYGTIGFTLRMKILEDLFFLEGGEPQNLTSLVTESPELFK